MFLVKIIKSYENVHYFEQLWYIVKQLVLTTVLTIVQYVVGMGSLGVTIPW